MRSFESSASGLLDRPLDADAISEEIRDERTDMESFRGAKFYENDEIDADLEQCHTIGQKIEDERRNYSPEKQASYERGLAAEYTFRHGIAEYGWLAPDVNMIVTSEYDDYVRGIDSIAQIITGPEQFEHLGFAIDFASGAEDVGMKIRRTFDSIDQGFTPSVKYFDSEKTGKLKNFKVPRIVIGASPDTLARLAAYSSEVMNGSGIAESVKQQLREDSFKLVIFGEIEAQLGVFVNRLQKVLKQAQLEKRPEIEQRAKASLSTHQKALATVQRLAEEAEITLDDIRTQMKGDIFAAKMAQALSALSLTPIAFKEKRAPLA